VIEVDLRLCRSPKLVRTVERQFEKDDRASAVCQIDRLGVRSHEIRTLLQLKTDAVTRTLYRNPCALDLVSFHKLMHQLSWHDA
jgi:hypothetical protein